MQDLASLSHHHQSHQLHTRVIHILNAVWRLHLIHILYRVSDAKLEILLFQSRSPMGTRSGASKSAGTGSAAAAADEAIQGSTKRQKTHSQNIGEWEECMHIPVHTVVLMAKSAHFNKLLHAALLSPCGSLTRPAVFLTEHAESMEEVQAILAAAECMYTGKMPVLCIGGEVLFGNGCNRASAQLRMHVKTLKVRSC